MTCSAPVVTTSDVPKHEPTEGGNTSGVAKRWIWRGTGRLSACDVQWWRVDAQNVAIADIAARCRCWLPFKLAWMPLWTAFETAR